MIFGGTGPTSIEAGSGDDVIFGESADTTIDGGTGDDTIYAGPGAESITGGYGNDLIYAGTGDAVIDAGTGDSSVVAGTGDDTITAAGPDSWIIDYAASSVTLTDTTLTAASGAVSSISGFRDALLSAGDGDMVLDASQFSGNTLLMGGTGNDTLIGSHGNDTLVAGYGDDSLVGGGGNDTFQFVGQSGIDPQNPGAADTFASAGSAGSVYIDEPQGTNIATLDFSQASAGISIDLGQTGPQTVIQANPAMGIAGLTVTLSDPMGISNVIGSPYNDTIIGNGRNNTLIGGGGQDLIAGLGGDDVLQGDVTRTVLLDFTTLSVPGEIVYTQQERDAIQAQLTADYSAFSYAFTQTVPASGSYTTIYFNDPVLTGLEGGLSTAIDWRDQFISGAISLISSQAVPFPTIPAAPSSLGYVNTGPPATLLATQPDMADVNINNFLGGPDEPTANFANIVGLSVTIAAHELGHLSGLEHQDAFGPIGAGFDPGLSTSLFDPAYTGPDDADQTTDHIIASGASVGQTIEEAIDDPFLGAREAIALAYGEDGNPIIEPNSVYHESLATATPISLQPLVVPDTVLEGTDADQVFDVTAADVVAFLGVNAQQQTYTDYYSFTGQAGTLMNIQVLTSVLASPLGAFDSTLTLYYEVSPGRFEAVAYNNNSFQTDDSWILDYTLPSTGTYYVAVGANAATASGQSGLYELFMYTFSEGADPTAGDTMYAGSGDDTIVGGPADDTVLAHFPQDTIVYGSGEMIFTDTAPILDVSAGPNQSVDEGTAVTLTPSFVDLDDADTVSYDWQVVSSNGQDIADGSGPSFTFTPGDAGTYTITFNVDGSEGSGTAQAVVTSSPVAPTLTPPSSSENSAVGEGTAATVDLGTLSAAGIGPWTVTVQWGDGQTSSFTTTSTGPLTDTHTYTTVGDETITETIAEAYGDTEIVSFPIDVIEPAVVLTGVPVSAMMGESTGSVPVATFTDPAGALPATDYTATIDWGDDTSSAADTITYASGTGIFTVYGTHTYTAAGSYTLTVTVGHSGALTATTTTTATLSGSPATSTSLTAPAFATYGQSATITATVSGDGTPTGAVALYLGSVSTSNEIGSGTLSVVDGQDEVTFNTPATLHASSTPYTLIAVYGGDGIHQGSEQSTTLTVNPYAFTYQIGNDSQTYGTPANLAHDLGTTISTGVGIQTLDIAYSSTGDTATAHVNTYAITGAVSSGTGLASDYSVTLASGTLTVSPYAFTYQIGNDTQTYGTPANFANDLGTTIATGVGGQTLGIAYSSSGDTPTANVNSYTITGSVGNGTGLATDYSVTFDSGTLTVKPYAFTFQIGNDTQVYGTPANFANDLGTSISTGVNGQTLDIAYSSTGDTATGNAGTYSITGVLSTGTGQSSNYNVTLQSGTLTINPYAFTYHIGNDSQSYGTPASLASALGTTINTGVGGQTLDIAYASTGDTTTANVGTYAITGAVSNGTGLATNYSVTLASGTLTVSAYAFTYQIGNATQTYGTAANLASALGTTIATGVNGQNLDITDSSTGDTATANVGTYSITAAVSNGTGLASDYSVTLASGTLTVSPYAFTYQIANAAQTYGTAANLASELGTTIATGVNGQNLDIAYSSTGDTASAAVGNYPVTGTLSNGTGTLSNYTVTLEPGTLSVTLPTSQSIYVLDPSAGGALSLSGSASISIPGTLVIDSSSSSAIQASGTAKVTASGGVLVEGGVSTSGSGKVTKTGTPGSTGNPLTSLTEPSVSGTPVSINLGGSSSKTIGPGVYSQINVSGSGKLTMTGGIYVIEGGGFSVSGAGSVTGSGVFIVNAGSDYPSAGGSYGGITLSGSGSYNLTPMTSGIDAGILFFQPSDNSKAMTVSGASTGMSGTIDAPSASLTVSGSGQIGTGLIVDRLTLTGAAVANALTPPAGAVAYDPAQIRAAYGIGTLALDGTGQTIAIVDAYDDPNIDQSLDDSDAQFGLTDSGPSLYSQYGPASSFLTILNQDGQPTGLPTTDPSGPGASNWELEEALDVEWAHAIAPGRRSFSSRPAASRSPT